MAVDTGHVVFTVNARCPGFNSGCCAFSIGVFDRELVQSERQFCRNTAPYFRLSCRHPTGFNRFVFAVEVILHMALTANLDCWSKRPAFSKGLPMASIAEPHTDGKGLTPVCLWRTLVSGVMAVGTT